MFTAKYLGDGEKLKGVQAQSQLSQELSSS